MDRRAEAREWLAELGERVVALGSLEAKGLEYDATVVVSPAEIADESPAGLRVLYVALTRATQQLTVVSGERDMPDEDGCPGPAEGLTDAGTFPSRTRRTGITFPGSLLAWCWHRLDPSPRAQPSSLRATTCREASMAGRCHLTARRQTRVT